jgi:Na+/H+ antiporter NhaD/arsenite permease-like protein
MSRGRSQCPRWGADVRGADSKGLVPSGILDTNAVKRVHLAWQIALLSVRDYDEPTAEFWRRSQPPATIGSIFAEYTLLIEPPSLDEAYAAVDFNTITLLLGTMIVVANLRLSGLFAFVNARVIAHARRPIALLTAIVLVSGIFSAFLVNDAICLVLTPLVLELTLALGRRPVPNLLAVAMASNIGSIATISGNPQNIMIRSFSQIPYATFALTLGPVAIIGLAVLLALIRLFHRDEIAGRLQLPASVPTAEVNYALLVRALAATVALIVLFFAGVTPTKAVPGSCFSHVA